MFGPSKLKQFFYVTFIVVTICLIISLTFIGFFFNELLTITSLDTVKSRDTNGSYVYEADISGNYYYSSFESSNGVKSSAELASFLNSKVRFGIKLPSTYSPQNVSNSSSGFTFVNSDNQNFITKNYAGSHNSLLILSTNSTSTKNATISTVNLSMLGLEDNTNLTFSTNLFTLAAPYYPIDGMNDKGVSASIHYMEETSIGFNTYDTSKKNVTETVMLRIILDYATNLDDAINIINSYDIFAGSSVPFSFFIRDKTGDSVIVSLQENGLVTYYNNNKNNSEASINVYQKETNEINNNFQYISNFCLTGNYSVTSSLDLDVYSNIETTINPNDNTIGLFEVSDSVKLLEECNNVVNKDYDHVYSTIYNLDTKTITYYFHSNFEKTYTYKL